MGFGIGCPSNPYMMIHVGFCHFGGGEHDHSRCATHDATNITPISVTANVSRIAISSQHEALLLG
jgi:hypothetical protein